MSDQPSRNIDQVRSWVAQGEAEVASLASEAEMAQVRLTRARKRLNLLYELLASVSQEPSLWTDPQQTTRSVRDSTISAAAEILRDRGTPMRMQDIHAEFVKRGKPLPGRGTPTNILAHLSTSTQFVRVARGVYALVNWGQAADATTGGTDDSPASSEV